MKPAIFKPHSKVRTRKAKGIIARWTSFVALVALLAMATLPLGSGHHSVAVQNSTHWSDTWHG